MSTPWYAYSEAERIENVYGKYTIKDFWNWWVGGDQKVMEVRIKDFELIKKVATELQIPWSASGVYVWNDALLKEVIKRTRQVTTWFGINPRKKNWSKSKYKTFGGKDTNIAQIDILFIDIDRKKKEGPATPVDLENCDKLANIVLERLATQGWNKNYIKICSGNGVQLAIKLDFPIKLPELEYDAKTGTFVFTEQFEKLRQLIPKGIGLDIERFCKKYGEELGVEIDKSVFNMGRVGALPFTKNYKYNGFTIRGIVELQTGNNDGLSDYILAKEDDIKTYKEKNVFTKTKALLPTNRIKPGHLHENIIVKFMLENDLPAGMRNSHLWLPLKCLLRDSGFDMNSEEFRRIHKMIEQKHGPLPANVPGKEYGFDENTVNKFCWENGFTPIYPLWPKKTKRLDIGIEKITWEDRNMADIAYKLDESTTILEDMDWLKKQFVEGSMENSLKFLRFIQGCINKYGEDKTKYYFIHIMKKYLCYE